MQTLVLSSMFRILPPDSFYITSNSFHTWQVITLLYYGSKLTRNEKKKPERREGRKEEIKKGRKEERKKGRNERRKGERKEGRKETNKETNKQTKTNNLNKQALSTRINEQCKDSDMQTNKGKIKRTIFRQEELDYKNSSKKNKFVSGFVRK